MQRSRLTQWLVVTALVIGGCQSGAGKSSASDRPSAAPTPQIPFIQEEPLALDQMIRRGDRVLFAGDDLTQQMTYTRAVAAALMALMPEYDLRFYNGGFQGATAANCTTWIDDLLDLTEPTVVFICLGMNDAESNAPRDEVVAAFRSDLGALIEVIAARCRQVVVMSPPGVDRGGVKTIPDQEANGMLWDLTLAAQSTAAEKKVAFVDLFVPMQRVYIAAAAQGQTGSSGLSLDGRLPNELGHVVLASAVLFGIGVSGEQLDPVGWSPLMPRKMRRIRGALGLNLAAPTLSAAQQSRDLYESIIIFDQWFFRIWRLAGKSQSGPSRQELWHQAEAAWSRVRQIASAYDSRSDTRLGAIYAPERPLRAIWPRS